MRLEQNLNEVAEFQIAVKDIQSKMHELYRVLKKNGFQMSDESLRKSLNAIFKDKSVEFLKGRKRGMHMSGLIDSGGITDNLEVLIEYVPGFSKYFRRFAKDNKYDDFFDVKKNDFFRTLAEVLSHEYKHFSQSISSKHKSMAKSTNPMTTNISQTDYYKAPAELDAFALQAAIQNIRTGDSDVINRYQYYFAEEDPKVWRKFLKKTNAYVKTLKKRGLYKYIKLK